MVAAASAGVCITWIGTGERPQDLEHFNVSSFVSRLLGMGDMARLRQLVEMDTVGKSSLEGLCKKLLSDQGEFAFVDLYAQLEMLERMGSIDQVCSLIPGFSHLVRDMNRQQQKRASRSTANNTMSIVTPDPADKEIATKTVKKNKITGSMSKPQQEVPATQQSLTTTTDNEREKSDAKGEEADLDVKGEEDSQERKQRLKKKILMLKEKHKRKKKKQQRKQEKEEEQGEKATTTTTTTKNEGNKKRSGQGKAPPADGDNNNDDTTKNIGQAAERAFKTMRVIMDSMCLAERNGTPTLLRQTPQRMVRIAKGSGTSLAQVELLCDFFAPMQKAMNMLKDMKLSTADIEGNEDAMSSEVMTKLLESGMGNLNAKQQKRIKQQLGATGGNPMNMIQSMLQGRGLAGLGGMLPPALATKRRS